MWSALERAARALFTLDGHPEDAKMDGKPLWQSYFLEVRAVLFAIRGPSATMTELFEGRWARLDGTWTRERPRF